MDKKHDPYLALRSRTYSIFITGNILDTIGTQMQAVAVGWEIYERTHSAALLGMVGFVQFIALLLVALPVGHLTDHGNRKYMVIASQVLTASAAIGLALASAFTGPLLLIFFCLFLLGIARSMNGTGRASLLTSLVPREAIHNAVTWNSNAYQVGTIVGPAVGGILIAVTGGAFWVYVIDAVSSLLFISLLLPLKIRPHEKIAQPFSPKNFLQGAHFISRTKLILATLTLDLFAVLFGGVITILPVYATDILHVGATGLGWLRAAPCVGALVMAFAMAHVPRYRHAGVVITVATAGFGVVTILFGISTVFWFSLLMLMLTGAFDTVGVVIRSVLVQTLTPDSLRGRVAAVNSIFVSSSNELGGFESGMAAQLLGTVPSVIFGGVGTVIVVAAVCWIWPELPRLKSLQEVNE